MMVYFQNALENFYSNSHCSDQIPNNWKRISLLAVKIILSIGLYTICGLTATVGLSSLGLSLAASKIVGVGVVGVIFLIDLPSFLRKCKEITCAIGLVLQSPTINQATALDCIIPTDSGNMQIDENIKIVPSDRTIKTQELLSILNNEFNLPPDEVQRAASQFQLVNGVIFNASGVIQDPAGSAIGSSNLTGGGLSGEIYKKFAKDLHPIPKINPGESVFNTGKTSDAKRILHTFSPHLGSVRDLKSVITLISDAYLNAITLFVEQSELHEQKTLNLCAISASIYGAAYALRWPDGKTHLDPSITEAALCIALAAYKTRDPVGLDDKEIKLFYYDNHPEHYLFTRALEVKNILEINQS